MCIEDSKRQILTQLLRQRDPAQLHLHELCPHSAQGLHLSRQSDFHSAPQSCSAAHRGSRCPPQIRTSPQGPETGEYLGGGGDAQNY